MRRRISVRRRSSFLRIPFGDQPVYWSECEKEKDDSGERGR